MHFDVDPSVRTHYPDLHFAMGLVADLSFGGGGSEAAAASARTILAAVNQTYASVDDILNSEYVSCYAAFYKSLGLKASAVSTPCKQAARVKKTQTYKPIFPILDLCMRIEYTTLISFQLYDPDKIRGVLVYRFAMGEEQMIDFHGESKICRKGDLLLMDDTGVVHSCAYGNHRDKGLQAESRRALVRIMKVPAVPADLLLQAQNQLAESCPVQWLPSLY